MAGYLVAIWWLPYGIRGGALNCTAGKPHAGDHQEGRPGSLYAKLLRKLRDPDEHCITALARTSELSWNALSSARMSSSRYPGLPQVYLRLDLMDTLIIMTYWPNDHTDAGERHGS